eukprot:11179370-Alexandrium_andersonii.AAC.1
MRLCLAGRANSPLRGLGARKQIDRRLTHNSSKRTTAQEAIRCSFEQLPALFEQFPARPLRGA